MEPKIFDQNAYRRAYYRAHPDKRLTQEVKAACSLLQRLGVSLAFPPAEDFEAAMDALVSARLARRRGLEHGRP